MYKTSAVMNQPPPSLLQAFREIAPCTGREEQDQRRKAACAVVGGALYQAGLEVQRAGVEEDAVADAIQMSLEYLVREGPRNRRYGDPTSDEGVQGWLRRRIWWRVKDVMRKRRQFESRWSQPELESDNALWDLAMLNTASTGQQLSSQDLEQAHQRFENLIVKRVVERKSKSRGAATGQAFLETVQQMSAIADHRVDFEQLLDNEAVLDKKAGGDQRARRIKARDRFYQRYSRAIRDLIGECEKFAEEQHLAAEEREAVLLWIHRLRLKKKR